MTCEESVQSKIGRVWNERVELRCREGAEVQLSGRGLVSSDDLLDSSEELEFNEDPDLSRDLLEFNKDLESSEDLKSSVYLASSEDLESTEDLDSSEDLKSSEDTESTGTTFTRSAGVWGRLCPMLHLLWGRRRCGRGVAHVSVVELRVQDITPTPRQHQHGMRVPGGFFLWANPGIYEWLPSTGFIPQEVFIHYY